MQSKGQRNEAAVVRAIITAALGLAQREPLKMTKQDERGKAVEESRAILPDPAEGVPAHAFQRLLRAVVKSQLLLIAFLVSPHNQESSFSPLLPCFQLFPDASDRHPKSMHVSMRISTNRVDEDTVTIEFMRLFTALIEQSEVRTRLVEKGPPK